MTNCSAHKKEVAGISDMRLLAEMIGDLHYETLAELLNMMAEKFFLDADKDKQNGRDELYKCLLWIYYGIHKASYGAERAWKVCKPFMTLKEDKP